ncbi:MAG: SDR family NAD(P)-dependent oxidoreductase [Microthrixaceae bacterium]
MANSIKFEFAGSRVAVTGGTSGIGHAIASAFSTAGAEVTVTGTKSWVTDYDAELSGFEFHQLQVDDPDSVDGFLQTLREGGRRLDVLVNNAGANLPGGKDEWDPATFAESVAINLVGPMRLTVGCRELLAASEMEGGGCVVNLASMASYRAITITPGYGAAKAAMVNLTLNLANMWAGHGIRVNAVAPGLIDTPMTAPMAAFPEMLDEVMANIPMARMGSPEELTDAVMFLCSSGARYMTGHTMAIDGGYLAG